MQLIATGQIGGSVLRTPKRDIFISKLKVKKDGQEISITYDLPPETTEQKTVTFSCNEEPRQEFFRALEMLLEDVCIICGLDLCVWEEEGKVTGITFKETEEEFTVTMTAQTKINSFPITVNTPALVPKDDIKDRINNVIAEIEDYISGKRSQQSLFE
jgi:hypothetical protein